MSGTTSADVVVAAGAVCWRAVGDTVEVLLVHREAQADISLPKGKVDAGELLPQTAVREIEEETGLEVALGAPLGFIEYTISGGRNKVVHYWAAEVTEEAASRSTFSPNQEIAAVEWLGLDQAEAELSYERDRDVLERFRALVDAHRHRTFAIIAVRHGKAVPPSDWDGPDATRPLLHRGLMQAAGIAPSIAAFRPAKLVSSTAARCQATLAPASALTGLPVTTTEDISQNAYDRGKAKVAKIVRKRLEKHVTAVLCSHSPVLPDIIENLARETGTAIDQSLRRAANLSIGEFSVLHVSVEHPETGFVGVETHSPLPAR